MTRCLGKIPIVNRRFGFAYWRDGGAGDASFGQDSVQFARKWHSSWKIAESGSTRSPERMTEVQATKLHVTADGRQFAGVDR